jgi:membrane protein
MNLIGTVRDLVEVLRENFATLVAGSIAYSAFMSVIPLLTLALVAASVLGQQQLVDQAIELTSTYLTPTGRDVFEQALQSTSGQAAASAFSFLLLLWSGLRVFRNLDTSFSLFYNTTGSDDFLGHLRDALLVFVTFGVAIAVSVGIGLVSGFLSILPMGWLFGPLLLVVPLVIAFLPIYYIFPNTDVTVREVLPGVVVAAVGWATLQAAFQLYTGVAGQYQVYGTIGAVLFVLTWLYIAGFLLLIGIAVNVVLADRTSAALSETPSRSSIATSE